MSEWQWWLRHYEAECLRLGATPDHRAAERHYHRHRTPTAAAVAARDGRED